MPCSWPRTPGAGEITCSGRARRSGRASPVRCPAAPYAGVVTALAIGDQRGIAEAQWKVFNRTGVGHLVSISGLHVTVFATIVGGLALFLARRSAWLTSRVAGRKIAAAIGVAAAGGYVLLAGAEIPALRTFAMLAVAAGGLCIGRPGSAAVVWLWALAAVLLLDPFASLTPGFWLSYGAVALLLYASAARLRGDAPHAWRARVAATIAESAHAQWVVTLGLAPLTLALFGQMSLLGPLANAVAIPVVTLAVVPLALLGIVLPFDTLFVASHAVLAPLMAHARADGRAAGGRVGTACAAARGRSSRRCSACSGCWRRAACRGAAWASSG